MRAILSGRGSGKKNAAARAKPSMTMFIDRMDLNSRTGRASK